LDDEEDQVKENDTETSEKDAAFNPLAEPEGQSDERNPLVVTMSLINLMKD